MSHCVASQKFRHLKTLSWLVFQTARVQRNSRRNIAENFSLRKRGKLSSAHLFSHGRVLRTYFAVRQKSIGDIPTYTLALYHIHSVLSIKYKQMFVFYCFNFKDATQYTSRLPFALRTHGFSYIFG